MRTGIADRYGVRTQVAGNGKPLDAGIAVAGAAYLSSAAVSVGIQVALTEASHVDLGGKATGHRHRLRVLRDELVQHRALGSTASVAGERLSGRAGRSFVQTAREHPLAS